MNKITQLFNIQYPVIQAGMIWASGYKLASAVSNAGGLGIIGAGSMYPDVLREHIQKCKKATDKPFAVNVPMLYPNINEIIQIIIEEGVKIVFTSAGNPKTWTAFLKEKGITVVHVVSSVNGGIATGSGMLAAMVLGADGVQIGSRFLASTESSSHEKFKQMVVELQDGDTHLTLKELAPVRLIKNKFFHDVQALYTTSPTPDDLKTLLGRARAKKGMFEGDLEEGELEIGQIAGLINDIKPAGDILRDIIADFEAAKKEVAGL
jgi:enoyl-[acyl-carrier protein] reductase II